MVMEIKTRFINSLHKNGYLKSNGIAQHLDEMGCVVEETVVYESVLDECIFGVAILKTTFHIVAYRRDEEGSLEVIYQDAGSYEDDFQRYFRAANDYYKENIKGGSEVELVNSHSISKQLERIGDEFSGQIVITVKDGAGITITTTEGQTAKISDSGNLHVEQEYEPKRSLTTVQAAEYLGVSIGTLQNWRSKKPSLGPPFFKIGRSVKYDPTTLKKWMDERRQ